MTTDNAEMLPEERPVTARGVVAVVLVILAAFVNMVLVFLAFFTVPFIAFSVLLGLFAAAQIRRTIAVAREDAAQKDRLARLRQTPSLGLPRVRR